MITLQNGETSPPHNNVGVWFSGDGNDANTIVSLITLANTTHDVQIMSTDDGNYILCALLDGTSGWSNNGSSTS